jgi:hypothetical protein
MITLIEILFGTWITVILSIIMVLFWLIIAIIPGYVAREFSKIGKTRIPLIILGIVLTAVYYIYFPWGVFDDSDTLPDRRRYHDQDIDIAATGWMDIDDLNKNRISFLYYQPIIIIESDRLFAYYRLLKAYEYREDKFGMQVLRLIGLILGLPAIIIHVIIYKLLGCLIAVLLILWAPSLSFTIGCFLGSSSGAQRS